MLKHLNGLQRASITTGLEKADQAKQQDYYRFPKQKLNASRILHNPEKIMISKTGSFLPKGQFKSSSVLKSYVHFPLLTMRSVLGSKHRSRSHYSKQQKPSHTYYTGMPILGAKFNILYLDKVFWNTFPSQQKIKNFIKRQQTNNKCIFSSINIWAKNPKVHEV